MAKFNLIKCVKGVIRNSPWLVIAAAIHVVIVAVMAGVYLAGRGEREPESATSLITSRARKFVPESEAAPELIDRKAVPKNEAVEVVADDQPEVYIPTTEAPVLTEEVGDPTAEPSDSSGGSTGGTSIGVGIGPGFYGSGRPSVWSARRPGPGGRRGSAPMSGATQVTEDAVRDGLLWLIRHQKEDGSWSAAALPKLCLADAKGRVPCVPDGDSFDERWDEGLTGLSLLCFLGAGYTFDSKQIIRDTVRARKHRLGEVVKNGLVWLKKRQREDGSFSEEQHMYNQVLATLALTEAYGLSQSRYWREPAQRAVDYLVAAQQRDVSGPGAWGWRYHSRAKIESRRDSLGEEAYEAAIREADTSVTTWVVMALKSAELSGLDVPPDAFAGAKAYIESVTGRSGLVGYQTRDGAGKPVEDPAGKGANFKYHVGTMSALGMLCRTFIDHDLDDPFLETAARVLVKDLPELSKDDHTVDYYYWYYGSLALNQFDGPDSPRKDNRFWNQWNAAMKVAVLGMQDATEKSCSRGGWVRGDRWAIQGSPIYNTAINTLTLEVYYRYASAFGGGERFAAPAQRQRSK